MHSPLNKLVTIILLSIPVFTHPLSYAFDNSLISYSGLNSTEQNIVIAVERLLPQTLLDLEESVNINSGSMNFKGVKQVGLLAQKQLSQLGFATQWIEGATFNRAGHIVAKRESENPDAIKILLIGHLDTVFVNEDNPQQFTRINDTEATGPGIIDMKGGNAIIIAAMRTLSTLKIINDVSITIVLTGDEENSGKPLALSKKAIIDAALWADIALGFENGDDDINTAMASRRGYSDWTLEVKGKPAHSSQIFTEEIGDGAIFETARILETFRRELSTKENLTFNPGMIIGGTSIVHNEGLSSGTALGKSNVIAQASKVTGDIRALSSKQLAIAQRTMHNIVRDNLNHTQATLTFESGYPPMALTSGNRKLLAEYSKVSKDLGYNAVRAANPRNAGAADISFAAAHVVMSLDGLGLMGRGSHTNEEVADLTSLAKNIEKTAILIYRLSLQGKAVLQQ